MSDETYTFPLDSGTADRLRSVAAAQGISPEAALAEALADYLSTWEEHLAEIADDDSPLLPWLKGPPED